MKTRYALLVFAAVSTVLVAFPASAHHSFAAQYDRNKTITLKGSVTKLDWINPHAFIFMDVKEGEKVTKWEVELGAPAMLMRNGWTRYSIKPGDVISVQGSLAKDGSNLANASSVTTADGKRVFAGSSADTTP